MDNGWIWGNLGGNDGMGWIMGKDFESNYLTERQKIELFYTSSSITRFKTAIKQGKEVMQYAIIV